MPQLLTGSWRAGLPDSATPIGISRGTPRRIAGYRRIRALEPGEWFRSVAPAQYLKLYSEILTSSAPHATYLFKHALVQDAAYGTLLREPRRALHARIGETLENQFARRNSAASDGSALLLGWPV
jgi:hypothetical protein